jgi:hypothetical protein
MSDGFESVTRFLFDTLPPIDLLQQIELRETLIQGLPEAASSPSFHSPVAWC